MSNELLAWLTVAALALVALAQAFAIRALRDERTSLFTTIDTLHRRSDHESVCVNPASYPPSR